MVDDYINNGTEQILVLCKEKNVSYRLDTPLVTLVKSFILSSVSWECCNNAVDSFSATVKDDDSIKSRNGDYIMNNLKRQRVSIGRTTASVTESVDKQNQLAMMKENRAKQLESIADALVSRLRSAEEAYEKRLQMMKMKKEAIANLKNEICASLTRIPCQQNGLMTVWSLHNEMLHPFHQRMEGGSNIMFCYP